MKTTVVLTAGGSGGHITPLLAIAAELKRLQPELHLVYIGWRGDGLGDIPAKDPHIDEAFTVRAGKLRRYHGEGLKQLLDVLTMFKNIRDGLYLLVGLWQSWRLIGRLKPAVVFSRGGFVSVPVALGAALRHVPFITHDSDAIPSLANRVIAPWAAVHAVTLPKEVYAYPPDKTVTTGIPVQKQFVPVNESLQRRYKQQLKLPEAARLLFVIGGGLGAQRINQAVAEVLPHLLREHRDLYVVHVVGRNNEAAMRRLYDEKLNEAERGRLQLFGYMSDVYLYSGAADIVITRAGATNLAEFAVQGKACIVVPNPLLPEGHQLKNAQYLETQGAAVIVEEAELLADPNRLAKHINELLKTDARRHHLGQQLSKFANPRATHDLAQLILKQIAR